MTGSVYERIGGDKAVEAAVDIFYNKIKNDSALHPFFDGMDMQRQRRMQQSFLTYAFGGPNKYTGRGLRAAHQRPAQLGLSDKHFDKVAEHLQRTLLELNVPYDLIQEVMTIAGGTREDVLNR